MLSQNYRSLPFNILRCHTGRNSSEFCGFPRFCSALPARFSHLTSVFELSPVLGQSFGVARSRGTHFVVTANSTDDGSALYLRADGSWAPRLTEAWPIASEAECEAAMAVARTQERHVCDPYTFKVVLGPQGPRATNTRERIRGTGPTTPLRRPDPLSAPAARLSA